MGIPQNEVLSMTTTSQPNEKPQELIRLFHQTEQTILVLSYNELAYEKLKPVLNTLAGYDTKHEISPLSIIDAKDVTGNLINAFSAAQISNSTTTVTD